MANASHDMHAILYRLSFYEVMYANQGAHESLNMKVLEYPCK